MASPPPMAFLQRDADTIARQAMESLTRYGVQPWPKNYEVLFQYLVGDPPDLRAAMDAMLSATPAPGQRELSDLHMRFLSTRQLSMAVSEASEKVSQEIDLVMHSVGSARTAVETYSAYVEGAARDLVAQDASAAVKAILGGVVRETGGLVDVQSALIKHLEASQAVIAGLQQRLEDARAATLLDPLTGLGNRRCFDEAMARSCESALSEGRPLALVMLDVDHFKRFNDEHGHLTGDQVLRVVAMVLRANIKRHDIACRYGGEEFAVILPDTDLAGATTVAERLRAMINSRELVKRSSGEKLGRITVSLGVAALAAGETPEALVERADARLYAAKRAGRDQVVGALDDAAY